MVKYFLLISLLAMFIAGLGANLEYGLQMIIALFTLRQLGLMTVTISIGLSGLAFFYLLTHALFKALLFMCAGGANHSIRDSQDIRFMDSLSVYMPLTSSCLMVSNFALCGIPFLSGFYSNDFILEMFSMRYVNMLVFLLCFIYWFKSLLFFSFVLFCFVW